MSSPNLVPSAQAGTLRDSETHKRDVRESEAFACEARDVEDVSEIFALQEAFINRLKEQWREGQHVRHRKCATAHVRMKRIMRLRGYDPEIPQHQIALARGKRLERNAPLYGADALRAFCTEFREPDDDHYCHFKAYFASYENRMGPCAADDALVCNLVAHAMVRPFRVIAYHEDAFRDTWASMHVKVWNMARAIQEGCSARILESSSSSDIPLLLQERADKALELLRTLKECTHATAAVGKTACRAMRLAVQHAHCYESLYRHESLVLERARASRRERYHERVHNVLQGLRDFVEERKENFNTQLQHWIAGIRKAAMECGGGTLLKSGMECGGGHSIESEAERGLLGLLSGLQENDEARGATSSCVSASDSGEILSDDGRPHFRTQLLKDLNEFVRAKRREYDEELEKIEEALGVRIEPIYRRHDVVGLIDDVSVMDSTSVEGAVEQLMWLTRSVNVESVVERGECVESAVENAPNERPPLKGPNVSLLDGDAAKEIALLWRSKFRRRLVREVKEFTDAKRVGCEDARFSGSIGGAVGSKVRPYLPAFSGRLPELSHNKEQQDSCTGAYESAIQAMIRFSSAEQELRTRTAVAFVEFQAADEIAHEWESIFRFKLLEADDDDQEREAQGNEYFCRTVSLYLRCKERSADALVRYEENLRAKISEFRRYTGALARALEEQLRDQTEAAEKSLEFSRKGQGTAEEDYWPAEYSPQHRAVEAQNNLDEIEACMDEQDEYLASVQEKKRECHDISTITCTSITSPHGGASTEPSSEAVTIPSSPATIADEKVRGHVPESADERWFYGKSMDENRCMCASLMESPMEGVCSTSDRLSMQKGDHGEARFLLTESGKENGCYNEMGELNGVEEQPDDEAELWVRSFFPMAPRPQQFGSNSP